MESGPAGCTVGYQILALHVIVGSSYLMLAEPPTVDNTLPNGQCFIR